MADREPVFLEEVLTPEQIQELKQAVAGDNLEAFRTFFESEEFPLLPEDELEEIPLTFYALGAHQNSTWDKTIQYRPTIFMYLLDHGADLNFFSERTIASRLSNEYFWDEDFINEVYTSLAANAAVLGNLTVLKLLYDRGADLTRPSQRQVNDEILDIPDETISYFVSKQLEQVDRDIKFRTNLLQSYLQTQAQGIGLTGQIDRIIPEVKKELNDSIKERIALARVYRWIHYITTEENIPAYRTTARNRKAYQNVLLRAPGLGRLEKQYMMSFVPKPAKFAVYPEHGFKRVNTTLFQGGKTRKRKQRKQRKTKGRK